MCPNRSEPGYRRPVLIIQSDDFNSSRIGTIVVAAMTSNPKRANAPGNVLAAAQDTGLPLDSVVNISQLLTVDREDLTEPVGRPPGRLLQAVEDGLRLILRL